LHHRPRTPQQVLRVIKNVPAAHASVRHALPAEEDILVGDVPARIRFVQNFRPRTVPVDLPIRLLHPVPVAIVRIVHAVGRLDLALRVPRVARSHIRG
jgi:hypothetical protein